MRSLPLAAALALTLAGSTFGPARAEEAPTPAPTQANATATPNAADLLFEQPQMKNAVPGSTITYDYLRRSGIAKGPFGAPLKDTVTIKVEPGKQPDGRNMEVEMFSGLNRRPAGPFEDMVGNPVVPLFLENHVMALSRVLEANPRYLKLAIRRGLRERATVTPTKVPFGGKEVDGWRIVMKPFEGDKMSDRMRGLENLTYTFVTSPTVPGEIVSMEAASKNQEGGELLEEKLGYEQKAG
ncbi:hypothetical protein [Methylobacterium sp. J-076]|uniref:hypothetical protein n=1 Tax=Methylobacterium sp. J-076 TaxID=2836655 RepID=UPI001FB9814C|nr:hypothetical protein [Methylobacterium sp. J-076]MCJ2014129.1 hypothetical protein [Methylobacterium sp. J-076]